MHGGGLMVPVHGEPHPAVTLSVFSISLDNLACDPVDPPFNSIQAQPLRVSASVGATFVVRSHLGWSGGDSFLAKSKQHGGKSTHFVVEVRSGNLVVSLPNGRFKATYYKPAGRPHLILRERSKTDDDELLAEAFQAALAKARELGWIA
jgi:hypothetical protein